MSSGKWFLQRLSLHGDRLELNLARTHNGRVPPSALANGRWHKLTLRYYASEDVFVSDGNYRRAQISMVDLDHWLGQARGLYAHREILSPFFERPKA